MLFLILVFTFIFLLRFFLATILYANHKNFVSCCNYELLLVLHSHSNVLNLYILLTVFLFVENSLKWSVECFFDDLPIIGHQSCIVNGFFLGNSFSVISHGDSLMVEHNVSLDAGIFKHFFQIAISIKLFFLHYYRLKEAKKPRFLL